MGRRVGARNKPLDQASFASLTARLRRIGQQAALVTSRLALFERHHQSELVAIDLLKRELERLRTWEQRVERALRAREER